MQRIVTRRVLGQSIIPKYNVRPPLVITDTFDFFIQLENFGFKIEEVKEEVTVKSNKEEKKEEVKVEPKETFIVSEPVNASIIGGVEIETPSDVKIEFEGEDKLGISIEKEETAKNFKKGFNKQSKK